MVDGICLSLITPGIVEVLNKKPDIDINNKILYQYHQTIYAKPDKENIFLECEKVKKIKITLPVKKMDLFLKKID